MLGGIPPYFQLDESIFNVEILDYFFVSILIEVVTCPIRERETKWFYVCKKCYFLLLYKTTFRRQLMYIN